MSRFQEGSLSRLKRKTGPDAWVFRWYEEINGERKYRKSLIGTVDKLPTRHAAEGAILSLRRNINSELRAPETVSELTAHYRKHELVPERKAFATTGSTGHYLKRHIEANFGFEAASGNPDHRCRYAAARAALRPSNTQQDPQQHVRLVQPCNAP